MTTSDLLLPWGWDAHWDSALAALPPHPHATPARVTGQERDRWTVQAADGSDDARIVRTSVLLEGPAPVTGDWVLVEPGPEPDDPRSIVAVFPRRSAISRGAAGDGSTEQVLAANVDVVWIVHGLDAEPNARRLERYLTAAWESGATPEVVLTKSDLVVDLSEAVAQVEAVAIGVPIRVVRHDDPIALATLHATLRPGATYVLLGSSGAGKSTLINALAGVSLSATGAVRDWDQKGRHTTTRRELFQIAGGALLVDTPGLREFRLWSADEGLAQTFPEIDALAQSCRFRDCRHDSEPGCAVVAAAESGALDAERLASYRKLRAESAWLERRDDPLLRAAAVARHKTALKTMKYHQKRRDG